MELLVYIALFAIITLFLGKQLKTIVNNFASGKQVAKQQADARDVISIMARDIRNTGLKVYLSSSTPDVYVKTVAPGVVVDADQSSFVHEQATPGDALTIYKARLNGTNTALLGVDTIKYYLSGTALMRDYKSTGIALTASQLAENVYALQFEYGVIASIASLFDQSPITSPSTKWSFSGSTGSKSNGTDNFTIAVTAAGTGYAKYTPTTSLSVVADQKYLVSLVIEPSNGFPENLNWLRFSFKKTGDVIVGSEKFLPYSGTIILTVPVTSSDPVNAFIEYDAKGAGQLLVKGVEAQCSKLGAYTWKFNPTAAEKLNTRAIRVYLLTRSANKTNTKITKSITIDNATVNCTGQYTWRQLTEIIDIPNNGMF